MKIGILSHGEACCLGAVYGDRWIELPAALSRLGMPAPEELRAFIRAYHNRTADLNTKIEPLMDDPAYAGIIHPVAETTFHAPVPAQPRLQTSRGNSALFTRHIRARLPKLPVSEVRTNFNIVGHNSTFELKGPGGWNLEIVMVMGEDARNVSYENAYDYVFGYTNMLDHSGGDPEKHPYRQGNAFAIPESEKKFVDYAYEGSWNGNVRVPVAVGPVIVTRDEIPDPHDMIQTERENGRIVSVVHTSAVLYTFQEMVHYLSSVMTLEAGDMFSCASIGYDGYPTLAAPLPKGAYYQGETNKIPPLRLNVVDARKN